MSEDRADWSAVKKCPIFAKRLDFADLDLDNLQQNQLDAVQRGAAMPDLRRLAAGGELVRQLSI